MVRRRDAAGQGERRKARPGEGGLSAVPPACRGRDADRGTAQAGNRPSAGFTLIELVVVMTILLVLAGMVSGAAITFVRMMKKRGAETDMRAFSIGLAAYKRDFGRYPPDDFIPDSPTDTWDSEHGMNEVLHAYLGLKLEKGFNLYGPYVMFKEKRLVDTDGDGFKEYLDPFGGHYHYAENASDPINPGTHKDSYDIVSPGPDGSLGPADVMTTEGGYAPTGGDPHEEDNIININ